MADANHTSIKIGAYNTIKRLSRQMHQGVYIAQHAETDDLVKLTVISVTDADYKPKVEQCKSILSELKAFEAPHVVTIKDYGNDGPLLYIATRPLSGGTLLDRMQWRKIGNQFEGVPQLPSSGEVLEIVAPLAQALDTIHAENIVHGQIDPNAIVFDRGLAYLEDVGLTRLLKVLYRLDTTNSFNMTRYTPPELWEGQRPQPETDQYSLACIVYELVTGIYAFPGKSIYDIKEAHNNDVVKPPHMIRPDVSHNLGMVFWQALAKPLDRRFRTVTEFYEQLVDAVGDDVGVPTDFATFKLD